MGLLALLLHLQHCDRQPIASEQREARVDGSALARGFAGDLEGLLDRRRLRFPTEVEHAFRADYAERWRSTNRMAFGTGLATFAAFGLVDLLATTGSLAEVWVLRFALGVPAVVAVIVASYAPSFHRFMQPMSAAVVFILGALIVGMEMVLEPDEIGYHLYLFGVAPVTTFAYAAPRLRFWYAAAAGWGIWLTTIALGFDHELWSSRQTVIEFAVILALLAAVNVAGMIGAYLMEIASRRRFIQERVTDRERERSELLLRNILPGSVADRLKRGENVAEAFNEATVMFADLVDFTPFAETRSPQDLMLLLNAFFTRFDMVAGRYEIEKIKTIGDCYMAVSGLPLPQPDHAERVVRMALRLLEEVQFLGRHHGWPCQLRVGVATGPVVAGVIGMRKFSYDLWGDTVNTASRMQSHAAPGEIRVTEATFQRLADRFAFDGPHMLSVKGKGLLPTYVVAGMSSGPPSVQLERSVSG